MLTNEFYVKFYIDMYVRNVFQLWFPLELERIEHTYFKKRGMVRTRGNPNIRYPTFMADILVPEELDARQVQERSHDPSPALVTIVPARRGIVVLVANTPIPRISDKTRF